METRKTDGRRKVWNRQGRGPDGLSRAIEPHELTENDLTILTTLERYPVLDSRHLFERSPLIDQSHFLNRLRQLSDPPNNYIRWPKEQMNRANWDRKVGIWARARRGHEELKKRGLALPENPYHEYTKLVEHQYYGYSALSSIELGGATLEMKYLAPLQVQISRNYRGLIQHEEFGYKPDMGAELTFANGLKGGLIVEVENDNDLDPGNLKKSSFIRKYLALDYIMRTRAYEDWGFESLMALFVSPHENKIGAMKRIVAEHTAGKGVPWLLLRHVVGWQHPYMSFKPDPSFYTGTWDRTGGYAPFSLSEPPMLKGGEVSGQ